MSALILAVLKALFTVRHALKTLHKLMAVSLQAMKLVNANKMLLYKK